MTEKVAYLSKKQKQEDSAEETLKERKRTRRLFHPIMIDAHWVAELGADAALWLTGMLESIKADWEYTQWHNDELAKVVKEQQAKYHGWAPYDWEEIESHTGLNLELQLKAMQYLQERQIIQYLLTPDKEGAGLVLVNSEGKI